MIQECTQQGMLLLLLLSLVTNLLVLQINTVTQEDFRHQEHHDTIISIFEKILYRVVVSDVD